MTDTSEGREAVTDLQRHKIANRLRGMFDMSVLADDDFNRLSPAGFRLLRQAHDALIAAVPSPAEAPAEAVKEALPLSVIKSIVTEYLSHRGERPYRVLRGGQELWETHVEAMLSALRYLPAPAPAARDERQAIVDIIERYQNGEDAEGNEGEVWIVQRILQDISDERTAPARAARGGEHG